MNSFHTKTLNLIFNGITFLGDGVFTLLVCVVVLIFFKKHSNLVLILLLASTSFSQNYKMAIGFKGGYPGYGSLNAKKSISKSDYLEASIGGFGRNSYSTGFHVELDYERMQALEEGFSFYYGLGALLGMTSNSNAAFLHLAPKAFIGLEYNFEDIPLIISILDLEIII